MHIRQRTALASLLLATGSVAVGLLALGWFKSTSPTTWEEQLRRLAHDHVDTPMSLTPDFFVDSRGPSVVTLPSGRLAAAFAPTPSKNPPEATKLFARAQYGYATAVSITTALGTIQSTASSLSAEGDLLVSCDSLSQCQLILAALGSSSTQHNRAAPR